MFDWKKTYDLQNCNDKNSKRAKKNKFSVYKGILQALVSGAFLSIAAAIVKQMKNIYPGQLAFYRFVSTFVFSLPEAVKCQGNLIGPQNLRVLLVIRSIFGAINIFFYFLAFRYLPLGESSVIIFSQPVFVTVAARVFLKEPCGKLQILSVFTTIAGIVLTARLSFKLSGNSVVYTNEYILGLCAAFGSLFFGTCQYIMIRKLKTLHSSIILLNIGVVASVITAILTTIVGNFQWHDCGLQGLFIVALCIVNYAGQCLMILALQCEMAGPVATLRAASEIVLAFVWQTLIFQDIPDVYSCIGAVLVGVSIMFLGVKKWVSSLPSDSRYGRKLGWMLK